MGGCVTHTDNQPDLLSKKGKTTEKTDIDNLARTSPLKKVEKAHELSQLLLSNICKRVKKTITNVILGYRASQHKFEASSFHQSCKGKSNTILIAVTTNNHVFGGFTPCTWTQDQYLTYQADDNCLSFLFSIQEGEVKSYKLKENRKCHAIMNDQELGPVFGEGHDIHISDKADKQDSWNNLGKSYQCDFKFGSLKANSLLTSEEKYRLQEYEIWDVQFS